MPERNAAKALFFDVFGTVVDWRSGVIGQLETFGRTSGIDVDWEQFADDWRGMYQPSMEAVRSGNRTWSNLDDLHLESLMTLIRRYDMNVSDHETIIQLSKAWHNLNAWPDVPGGLRRLKKRYVLSTLSNGNTSLLVNMAKHAGLPWDVILSAETALAYKPTPDAYLRNIALLDLRPEQAMMVAAHNDDLKAARALGMQTAFILRPGEHGQHQKTDLVATGDWDYTARSFEELADQLDC